MAEYDKSKTTLIPERGVEVTNIIPKNVIDVSMIETAPVQAVPDQSQIQYAESTNPIPKPRPKYTKTEYSEIAPNVGPSEEGDIVFFNEGKETHKHLPLNWQNYIDYNNFSGRDVREGQRPPNATPQYSSGPPLPPGPPTPGPCCMNDTYFHETTTGSIGGYYTGQHYYWDAISETFYYPWHWDSDHNTPGAVGDPNTVGHVYYDRLYYPQPATSKESGGLNRNMPNTYTVPPPPGTQDVYLDISSANNPFVKFMGGRVGWNGTTARMYDNQWQGPTKWWAFPPRLDPSSALWGANAGNGVQTMWDWSNSMTVIPDLQQNWAILMGIPEMQQEKWNEIPEFIYPFFFYPIPIYVPFCNGRAGLNPGIPHYDNPWVGKSYASTFSDGKLNNPRRLGWEGWIKRPTNVGWNWGNRGAFKEALHYTLGPSEFSGGTIIDNLPCNGGHGSNSRCQYPNWPSIVIFNNVATGTGTWIHPDIYHRGLFPYPIKYDQLQHQEACCSNSQWFQNNRVLRNFSETTWNMIGSPWNGGSTTITMNPDQTNQWTLDLATIIPPNQWWGLLGSNGNGPPFTQTYNSLGLPNPPVYESPNVRYSCSTYYTLNRILQYISNSQDFEEIYAITHGNNNDGTPAYNSPKRMWFPVQSGYYARGSAISPAFNEPWENQYRLRDVHEFYSMVNFCDDAARDGSSLGTYGTLGNPPIGGGIDTTTGAPTSKLHPGTWPWGHCITYACGNPTYSPNYDSGTTTGYGGVENPKITFNKLGERGCEAQTPWASLPVNNYYSNITFEGIDVSFYDEARGGAYTKIRVPRWSFSNSPDWQGQVPQTFEEAKESAIGLMMWLGHNSWDYNATTAANPDGTVGRPAARSGGTAIQYWNPVNTNWQGIPNVGLDFNQISYPWSQIDGFTHYVADLNHPTMRASTNGYFKGIRPNFSYLDVVEHIERMKEQFPIKYQNHTWDYNNRPEGMPEYLNGVAVPGTVKTNNPRTGIAYDWWVESGPPITGEPDGWPPYEYSTIQTVNLGSWAACDYFPGSSVGRFITNSPYAPLNYPAATDPSWQGTKDGPGDPGGGNFCTQWRMVGMNEEYGPPNQTSNGYYPGNVQTFVNSCYNWPLLFTNNEYINNCFEPGMQGTNNVQFQTPWNNPWWSGWLFKPGDIRGRFKYEVMGCSCYQWKTPLVGTNLYPTLVPGPHCQGCDIGCCTNEFNEIAGGASGAIGAAYGTLCEFVYPQGLFKSKHDCAAAHEYENDTIPTSMVPAFFASQAATTPIGRRKTEVSNLQPQTFCKKRPPGVPGCLDPDALNYSPAHTEDCSGSIAHSYFTNFNISVGLNITVDNSCCVMSVPGWECDETVDNDNDGLGDCSQTCTYTTTNREAQGCYSAKTCSIPSDICCLDNCPFNPTHLPGYSCNYPNTPHGCAQNCLYNIANPTAACPHTSMTDCENANGGTGSPHCGPQSGWYCSGGPPLSVIPWNPGSSTVPSQGSGGVQLNFGTNVVNGQNMYMDGCSYTNNWWATNPFTPVLYNTKLDCLADCSPCAGKGAQDWCDDIMDELVSQFGSQATESNLLSAQFADPNPTNQPYPYSPNYDSSWWFKYRHCCQGRLPKAWGYNHINETSYAGLVGFGQNLSDGHASQTPKTGLGYRMPSPGNTIAHNFTSPGWWCSNFWPDYTSKYTTSGVMPYEWINGQGYKMKNTLSTYSGPDGDCEGEQGRIHNFEYPLIT